ncbi:MAG: flavodoxin [Paramuribaculum sp.]|nr:flavodoxin [Paramuribaculum sp.]
MKKIGIFYGSSTGTTKSVAERIGTTLGISKEDVFDVANVSPSKLADYDVLLLGTSTWGSGELEDDWYDFIAGVEEMYLKDKTIALFGCGDENMSDTFCDGVGILYDRLQKTDAKFIGAFNTEGYEFSNSEAVKNGSAVGLLLDEVNKPSLSDKRIAEWSELLKSEF